jgi:hypothetical protein
VPSTDVLDECVTSDHDAGGAISLQSSHRAKPGLQSSVVGLDSNVRELSGVVERKW